MIQAVNRVTETSCEDSQCNSLSIVIMDTWPKIPPTIRHPAILMKFCPYMLQQLFNENIRNSELKLYCQVEKKCQAVSRDQSCRYDDGINGVNQFY